MKSLRAAAERYGISPRTFRRYLHFYGYPTDLGQPGRRAGSRTTHYACVATWVREHPGVTLPRSVSKIADLTDCSIDAVKSYLKRRRQELAKEAELIELPKMLQDTQGRHIPVAAVAWYQIYPSLFDDAFIVVGKIKAGGQFTAPVPRRSVRLKTPDPSASLSPDGKEQSSPAEELRTSLLDPEPRSSSQGSAEQRDPEPSLEGAPALSPDDSSEPPDETPPIQATASS